MNPELLSQEESNESFEDTYVNPENIETERLEAILKEGQVSNIRTIEEHNQKVPPHADRTLLGDIVPHADQIFEAEIPIPEENNKKLLVVYKPESGINKGTDQGKIVPIPEKGSLHENKEIAAWVMAKYLGLQHLVMPVVKRELQEGEGSLRPYIWGEPLEILPEDVQYQAFENHETLEDIALYDYLLQTIDRRDANLIWDKDNKKLKAIDHSLTFFSENYADRWEKKGPRLQIAFDNSVDPPKLKYTPIPNRLMLKIHNFIENKDQICQNLSELLTEEEISDIFIQAQKVQGQKIFL